MKCGACGYVDTPAPVRVAAVPKQRRKGGEDRPGFGMIGYTTAAIIPGGHRLYACPVCGTVRVELVQGDARNTEVRRG